MASPRLIYLHGLASSPRSAKARFLAGRAQAAGLTLQCPDLNTGGFSRLTFARMLDQTRTLIRAQPDPVLLLGSSLGGLVAAWCAQGDSQVKGLLLLAPAFEFLQSWLPRLPVAQRTCWEQGEPLWIHHHGENKRLPLGSLFLQDMACFSGTHTLVRPLPTRIVHGRQDDVIDLAASRRFAASRPWVRLLAVDADHRLAGVSGVIWRQLEALLTDTAAGEVAPCRC
ncbi:MAG: alpha/beta fold hydrolase [Synechococcus sp. SB0668_bin_13]|nr:alpha/beta fold hydrolase [Cyanobacteria bacterium MAG IRC4_bin_6]MXW11370.1 alpha/beta fold hydrolase [Synechococcus sp. SB0668_bin_13]MXY19145.1 alpha/beta fold hydrolase [Synechococcus sp. SB0664_bin_36]MYK07164.1 alpha/beta fold hydrolase [Synechococcus sp. SB0670_bin_20]